MLDHIEYVNLGGSIEDFMLFERVQHGVIRELDRYTFGRVSKLDPVPEEVKHLITELCELAVPYGSDTDDKFQSYKDRLIRTYLADVKTADGTPVLYRGVDA